MRIIAGCDANAVWVETMNMIMNYGETVHVRGMRTEEIRNAVIQTNLLQPVMTHPFRNLSYKFMAAEAHWILSGDNRVETIAPYSSKISQFSDDGEVFFGAYGPKIMGQIEYVIGKLLEDNGTRQAVINIWRENPPPTKDVPCTVAMSFNLRHGRLDQTVFMRSSDAWLGLPYDIFNFSMIGLHVCAAINSRVWPAVPIAHPRYLTIHAVSSHLYEKDVYRMNAEDIKDQDFFIREVPQFLWKEEGRILPRLKMIMNDGNDAGWW